ncbi:MAG: sulfite exporter TauE/SafE family protein [Oscillospiraceae bacterium]|nr:sulfite exporter TauE/SafE family protein [Oscillospiraceae bacterium]
MQVKKHVGIILAGFIAGCVNGLFGAGGGMVLVPLLTALTDINDDSVFPTSVSIILPICLVSLLITIQPSFDLLKTALPYLFGSGIGGILAGFFGKKIPTIWLHRLLGALIIWGGIRYLC